MFLTKIVCVLSAMFLAFHPTLGANKSDYYALYDWLFAGDFYRKQIRPTSAGTSATIVYLGFNLLSINEVDEKQQTFITSARFNLYWLDEYLAWDPVDYGEIYSLLVPQSNIYRPDIVIDNSATSQSALGYNDLPVRLYDNGLVEWEPSAIISTSCDIDITFFPFDTQKCIIGVTTAVATFEEILVYIKEDSPISMDDFSENGQWDIIDYKADNVDLAGNQSQIEFKFLIKRRRTFYVMNIILPIFFLSLTASLVFALPAEEGEKMGTGITVLLAFAVYLTILSDLVPNTSLQISILGLYLTILLGFSAISLIVCAFILRLHARPETYPVGTKMTKWVRFIRKMTGDGKDVEQNRITPLKINDIEIKEETKPEPLTWQEVVFTLDSFSFVCFTFLTIFTTVVCLMAIGIGGAVNVPSI